MTNASFERVNSDALYFDLLRDPLRAMSRAGKLLGADNQIDALEN